LRTPQASLDQQLALEELIIFAVFHASKTAAFLPAATTCFHPASRVGVRPITAE
jgi:hypothetical protein